MVRELGGQISVRSALRLYYSRSSPRLMLELVHYRCDEDGRCCCTAATAATAAPR